MICKNCDQSTKGDFCNHCGQRTIVSKINLASTISELSYSVFQLDRGLFYSMKELFIRPGDTIREYLDGKRKNHFKPIAYVFTLSTAYFLISRSGEDGNMLAKFIESIWEGWIEFEIETNKQGITSFEKPPAINWIANNYSFAILIILPLFSFASYLVFIRQGYNYFEHLVLNAYITGQQAIFYSLSAVLSLAGISNYYLPGVTLSVILLYVFIVFWQFFPKLSRVQVVVRSFLTYILYWILIFPILYMIIASGV